MNPLNMSTSGPRDYKPGAHVPTKQQGDINRRKGLRASERTAIDNVPHEEIGQSVPDALPRRRVGRNSTFRHYACERLPNRSTTQHPCCLTMTLS